MLFVLADTQIVVNVTESSSPNHHHHLCRPSSLSELINNSIYTKYSYSIYLLASSIVFDLALLPVVASPLLVAFRRLLSSLPHESAKLLEKELIKANFSYVSTKDDELSISLHEQLHVRRFTSCDAADKVLDILIDTVKDFAFVPETIIIYRIVFCSSVVKDANLAIC